MTPNERQAKARQITGYGAIMLRREGDYAIVEVEKDAVWVEVIREFIDSPFSHIIEPLGIETAMKNNSLIRY